MSTTRLRPPPGGRIVALLGPREPAAASRAAGLITLVAAAVTGISSVLDRTPAPWRVDVLLSGLLVALGVILLRGSLRWRAWLCLATPLLGVMAVASLDLLTADASAGAQVFFCLPVLYGAWQLRTAGAVLVCAAALAGQCLVAFTLLTSTAAITDVVFVGSTLVLVMTLLVRSEGARDRLVRTLEAQAAIDPVTGLATRWVLDDATRCALSGGVEPVGTSLIIVDIDHFKQVNDSYGHPVGDASLAHVAALLTAYAGPGDVVARLGGDELALLLPGCSLPEATSRAHAIVEAVASRPLSTAAAVVPLSVSAGVSHGPAGRCAPRELYAAADAQLYRAKSGGRRRACSAAVAGPTTMTTPVRAHLG